MKKIVFTILILLAFVAPTYAWYGSAPSKPSCLDMLVISRDRFSFDMCRSDMERYKSDVESHIRQVRAEYNKSVEKFNCHARGETICF